MVDDSNNLVEVDFTSKPDKPGSDVEQHLTYDEWVSEIKRLRRDVNWRLWRNESERRSARRTIRRLEQELRLERASMFDDADVLAALNEHGEPVTAKRLVPCLVRRPTQSAAVRVGLALGRLERQELVLRVVEGDGRRIPNTWAPTGGGHA